MTWAISVNNMVEKELWVNLLAYNIIRLLMAQAAIVSGVHPAPPGTGSARCDPYPHRAISMPDTPDNQARYPQPSSQARGVGFPLARLVGVICLSTGGVIDAAMGPFEGKGHSELSLFQGLLGAFRAGDVMLADALYCTYWLIAGLQASGVDVVFEQNGTRITDFRRGRRLGVRDHVVSWHKPQRPHGMSRESYDMFPDELIVREVKVEGRVLVTTMLDPRKVKKTQLPSLYVQRWHVELDFRNIKTTLDIPWGRCGVRAKWRAHHRLSPRAPARCARPRRVLAQATATPWDVARVLRHVP